MSRVSVSISVPANAVFYNKDSAEFSAHDRSVQGAVSFCSVGEEQYGTGERKEALHWGAGTTSHLNM